MNTSEYPPDGVYFRSAPDWAQTPRTVGLGFYAGDRLELQCWQTGSNVPRRDNGSNNVWYQARNVTRPKAPKGQVNQGWVNAHFVNDGLGPNEHVAGVGRCDSGSTLPIPAPAPSTEAASTVYYSPYNYSVTLPFTNKFDYDAHGAPAVVTNRSGTWQTGSCGTANAGRGVTGGTHALAGWSAGRLGPIYYLANASLAQKRQMNYILMIDPGNYSDLSGCDKKELAPAHQTAGSLLASWLTANPNARLVILSGNRTTQSDQPINGRANAGIQNIYFNDVRASQQQTGSNIRSRIMVCNYKLEHAAIFHGVQDRIGQQFSNCPDIAGQAGGKPWNP